MNTNDLYKNFLNPSAIYRTAPLWVWDDDMTHEQIEMCLNEFKAKGFGGAFVHPRPGMRISYLSKEWFEAWGYALKTAKALDLKLYIYDENSYPSGFGGGHVSAELPDCWSKSVSYSVFSMDLIKQMAENNKKWFGTDEIISVCACDKVNGKMTFRKDLTYLPKDQWGGGEYAAVVKNVAPKAEGWLAGFANVDPLRPEVTEFFIKTVYQAYYDHFGDDFGSAIPAIFTDEPSPQGSGVYGSDDDNMIPLSHWFCFQFQQRKGYDLMNVVPALFEDWNDFDCNKIRYDYYEVTQQLWTENFLIPISNWCQEHHIAFTGHFMEDGWPNPYFSVVSPDVMSYYEYQDWPGIDLLIANKLRNAPSDFQYIILLQLMSAAHQFGKKRAFCEAYGAGGWDSTFEDYKRLGDYLEVNGINFINPHLVHTSYIGARKRDYPQSFDWKQPWWNEYKYLNDYFARISYAMSMGTAQESILVINPTMTAFFKPKSEDISELTRGILSKDPDMRPFLKMIQLLKENVWDINLADETIMDRYGIVSDHRLKILNQKYKLILLHSCTKDLNGKTVNLLIEFMNDGGQVFCIGDPGNYIDGTLNVNYFKELKNHENFIEFGDFDTMNQHMCEGYSRMFEMNGSFPEGVEVGRRIIDNNELYMFANHSHQEIDRELRFTGSQINVFDAWTGSVTPSPKGNEGKVSFKLHLKDNESIMLFVLGNDSRDIDISVGNQVYQEDDINNCQELQEECNIKVSDDNAYPIEYCDLVIDRNKYADMSTITAGNIVFQKRGFISNPWDNKVQYKNRTKEYSRFYANGSGFAVTYHFSIANDYTPEDIRVAVENGSCYDITINGSKIQEIKNKKFLEMDIDQYDLTPFVKNGDNEICLVNHRFDVKLEIEPVILLGNFGVYNQGEKWVIDKRKNLEIGSWRKQGYPFYFGSVTYTYHIQNDEKANYLITLNECNSTCVSCYCNGQFSGFFKVNGNNRLNITPVLVTGDNTVEIKVCGSYKNLYGPHFDVSKPRGYASPELWKTGNKVGIPNASEYDLIDYGMLKPIRIDKRNLEIV